MVPLRIKSARKCIQGIQKGRGPWSLILLPFPVCPQFEEHPCAKVLEWGACSRRDFLRMKGPPKSAGVKADIGGLKDVQYSNRNNEIRRKFSLRDHDIKIQCAVLEIKIKSMKFLNKNTNKFKLIHHLYVCDQYTVYFDICISVIEVLKCPRGLLEST